MIKIGEVYTLKRPMTIWHILSSDNSIKAGILPIKECFIILSVGPHPVQKWPTPPCCIILTSQGIFRTARWNDESALEHYI